MKTRKTMTPPSSSPRSLGLHLNPPSRISNTGDRQKEYPGWQMHTRWRKQRLHLEACQKMKLMQYLNIKKEFRQVEKHLRLNNWQYTEKLRKQENKAIINFKESFLKLYRKGKVITGYHVAQLWVAFTWSWSWKAGCCFNPMNR